MRQHGWDKFEFSIIEICKNEKIYEREKYWISKLNSLFPNGYNLVDSQLKGCKRHSDLKQSYSKKVILYDLKNNNKEMIFDSAKDACRYLNLSQSAVSQALYRKQYIQNRYAAKYANDERNAEQIIEEIEIQKANAFLHISEVRQGRKAPNNKRVMLTNIDTNKSYEFKSVNDAAMFLKRQTTNVSHACKKKGRIVANHYANYLEDNE